MSELAYIYLLQDGNYKGSSVYKIGRTVQKGGDGRKLKRLQGYSQGTIPYNIWNVNPKLVNIIEKTIKENFNNKYNLIRGSEWFEGDVKDMKKNIDIIIENIYINNSDFSDYESEDDVKEIDDTIPILFPNYKDDIVFGGIKRLIRVEIKRMPSIHYGYTNWVNVSYIDKNDDGYEVNEEILQEDWFSRDKCYEDTGDKYIEKLLKYVFKNEDQVYDLNNTNLLAKLNKYKTKVIVSKDIIQFAYDANKKVNYNSTYNCINHYIFNNCIINDELYCDIHNNSTNRTVIFNYTIPYPDVSFERHIIINK